jgi:hypothetical protein
MSEIHPFRTSWVPALSAASLAFGPPLVADATPAGAASNLCQKVSLAEVSSTLGVNATKVSPRVLSANSHWDRAR